MDMVRQVQAVIRLPKLRTKMLHKMEKGGLSRLFHAVLTDSGFEQDTQHATQRFGSAPPITSSNSPRRVAIWAAI